ncbi:hypothetical protein QE152_g9555 [Popillia japonica]|uniref:Uncharacterized protein n=1 Tax=Popillia japonica TaxID=7064 RepID=A0AAW1LYR3_POPJA
MEQKKHNLNRSFSEPDIHLDSPYFRQVIINEYCFSPHGEKPLIRHISYSEVNVNNSNRQWEHSIATAKLNPFNTSGSNTDKKTIVKNLKFEASPEIEVNTQADPMDVDDDEYDYNLHAKPYTTYEARRLNTKSIPLKRKCDKSKTNSSTYLLGSLIVVLLCYIIFHLNLFEESKLEPPQHIINDLENILHQDHVKDITSRSLNNLEKWLKNQIRERGLTHKEEEIFSLLEDYDVEVHGFKGLLPKINVLAL